MSEDKKFCLESEDGKVSVSFDIQDTTKEAFGRVESERLDEVLAGYGLGGSELIELLQQLYIQAGSPCGPGAKGLIEWIEQV